MGTHASLLATGLFNASRISYSKNLEKFDETIIEIEFYKLRKTQISLHAFDLSYGNYLVTRKHKRSSLCT